MRHAPRRPRRIVGFTLIELLIVIMIIGILLGFIMVAAVSASRDAQERATQALIAKLDSGLGDRLEALLAQRLSVNMLPTSTYGTSSNTTAACTAWSMSANGAYQPQREGVLLRYEQIKHEVPDVFVVQGSANSTYYPLNFAMTPYYASRTMATDYEAVYPIGTGIDPATGPVTVGWGIWGASYTFLTGMYKNLGKYTDPISGQQGAGFLPRGYDGVDNNGNTLIDEMLESGGDASITTALGNHKHVTARAECLYALLVEGQGPYGSVFNRDDFTNNEVRDTDQDGLPEFVDGWGNPLQFYRWPIFYHSDAQRGLKLVPTGAVEQSGPDQNEVYGLTDTSGNVATPYGLGRLDANHLGSFDSREQDPLDPNQQLLDPTWYSAVAGLNLTNNQFFAGKFPGGSPNASAAVSYFQTYFHQITEPLLGSGGLGTAPTTYQRYWDRSIPGASYAVTANGTVAINISGRRAFFTRFLILSAGPDGKPGTPYLTDKRYNVMNNAAKFTDAKLQALSANTAAYWMQMESQAAQASLDRSPDGYLMPSLTGGSPASDGNYYTNALQADGLDDITNHNLSSTAGPVQ